MHIRYGIAIVTHYRKVCYMWTNFKSTALHSTTTSDCLVVSTCRLWHLHAPTFHMISLLSWCVTQCVALDCVAIQSNAQYLQVISYVYKLKDVTWLSKYLQYPLEQNVIPDAIWNSNTHNIYMNNTIVLFLCYQFNAWLRTICLFDCPRALVLQEIFIELSHLSCLTP